MAGNLQMEVLSDQLTGEMYRSQKMELHKLLIPGAKDLNVARQMMESLLRTKSVMILDMNTHVTDGNRRYRMQEHMALDCEKRLRGMVNKANDYLEAAVDGDDAARRCMEIFDHMENHREDANLTLEEIEEKLVGLQREIATNDKTVEDLTRQFNNNQEHKYVLELCSRVLAAASDPSYTGSYDPGFGGLVPGSRGERMPDGSIGIPLSEGPAVGAVSHICGVINEDKRERFHSTLFRIMRSNIVVNFLPLHEDLVDPRTGEKVKKTVFIAFITSQSMLEKTKKICDAFQCNIYDCPRMSANQLDQRLVENNLRTPDFERLAHVISTTKASNVEHFKVIAANLSTWGKTIREEWRIFNTLNKFKQSEDSAVGEYLFAKCWIPAKQRSDIQAVLGAPSQGNYSEGQAGILSPPDGRPEWPSDCNASLKDQLEAAVVSKIRIPTYFATNKYTGAFQGIVDAYGVAKYQEANPTLFALSIFPFLFGVMFGDILHGSILLAFAVLCIVFEEKLKNVDQEMFKIPFGGRYMLIVMSVTAIYMGFIYNEVASAPLDLFGTRYGSSTHLDFHTNPTNFTTTPYTLGVDPIWRWSNNNVGFTNSMKMKMAIILGVLHMTLGVLLKAGNMIHFGDRLSLYCESVPEVLLFMSIFGYLCILIFLKWGTNWNVGPDCAAMHCSCEDCFNADGLKVNMTEFSGECEQLQAFIECAKGTSRIQYPRGPPMLITTLIGLAFMGEVKHQDVLVLPSMCNAGPSGACYGQGTLQMFLLLIAGLSAPAMLIIKPMILKKQNEKEEDNMGQYGMVGNVMQDEEDEGEGLVGVGSPVENHDDEEEGFNFAEVFIHQIIHTIEYALGTVSNTASCLRLWALSLAHSQLSEVFWDMIFLGEKFHVGLCTGGSAGAHVFMIIFCFFIWFCATMAVLMVMESLSAFLHALRLQWVEFQNKFYASDGILFHPDSFDMEEVEG